MENDQKHDTRERYPNPVGFSDSQCVATGYYFDATMVG